jgi:hypothetical protein
VASIPPESIVVVRTVSPGQIVSTGARSAEKLLAKDVGTKLWICGPPGGRSGTRRPVKP